MERPSHITLSSVSLRRRLPLFALAAFLQAGIVWMFAHGLHVGTIKFDPGPLDTRFVDPDYAPRTPPPVPKVQEKLELPTVQKPDFDTARDTNDGGGITTGPKPAIDATPRTPLPPDHAPVGIANTHTTPPYPPVALRTGEEGKVTLQLAIAPTGRVTRADVLVSSGHDDLDRSAQDWIVAHWAYRPALDKGEAVAGQAMTTVTFSLKNAR